MKDWSYCIDRVMSQSKPEGGTASSHIIFTCLFLFLITGSGDFSLSAVSEPSRSSSHETSGH